MADPRTNERGRVGYFSNRCGHSIEVKPNTYSMCGLLINHAGDCEPIKPGRQTVGGDIEKRLQEVEARIEWCEGWRLRPGVKRPQITREWVNLLEDAKFLIDVLRGGREDS
jgi:hypothetical protein